MKSFESFLSPQLNEFIAYRQNLRYSIKPVRARLLCFDRYLRDKKIKPSVLQPSVFLEFRNNLKMEPMSINGVLSVVRIFFNFLVRKDYYPSNPLKDIPPLPEPSFWAQPFFWPSFWIWHWPLSFCWQLPPAELGVFRPSNGRCAVTAVKHEKVTR